ncbi:MAG: WHG domain-containing protein, partial [Pseudomonadota bacterium]|nr:WHG domain-containing protein [Pseudomonadota bacterium]
LTAVATEAFRSFGDALAAASGGSSREDRIFAQGLAYVRFALAEPAKFDLMWRYALIDREDPDYVAASRRAFGLLSQVTRGADPPEGGAKDPEMAPAIACWSIVHGFARLALDGAFGIEPGAAERAAEALLPRVLEHLRI